MKLKIIIPVLLGVWIYGSVSYAAAGPNLGNRNFGNSERTGVGTTGANLGVDPVKEQPLAGGPIDVVVTAQTFTAVSLSFSASAIGDPRSKFRLQIQSPESNVNACFYEFVTATVTTTTATGVNIEPGGIPTLIDNLPWNTMILLKAEDAGDECVCKVWYAIKDDTGD